MGCAHIHTCVPRTCCCIRDRPPQDDLLFHDQESALATDHAKSEVSDAHWTHAHSIRAAPSSTETEPGAMGQYSCFAAIPPRLPRDGDIPRGKGSAPSSAQAQQPSTKKRSESAAHTYGQEAAGARHDEARPLLLHPPPQQQASERAVDRRPCTAPAAKEGDGAGAAPASSSSRNAGGASTGERPARVDAAAPAAKVTAPGAKASLNLRCTTCSSTLAARGVAVYRFRDASYCATCRQRAR